MQNCHPERGLVFAPQAQRPTAVEGPLSPRQSHRPIKAFSDALRRPRSVHSCVLCKVGNTSENACWGRLLRGGERDPSTA